MGAHTMAIPASVNPNACIPGLIRLAWIMRTRPWTAQTVAKPSMRALASALIALTATCFGQGVGPLAVGVVNDALKGAYGADAVRYSLLSAAVTTTLGALLFVWAAQTIRTDIKRAS